MKNLNKATLMNDEIVDTYGEPIERFSMEEFEVDGIVYRNPHIIFDRWMFSLKPEFDSDDAPADTGGLSYRWNPDRQPSMEHWMRCQTNIAIGEFCYTCGELAV